MRPAAEWLLLPLFLLPFVLGGALALWAKGAHDAALAPYKEDARQAVRAWVSPPRGRAAWMGERIARTFGEADAEAVPFTHPRFSGRVRLPGHGLGPDAWVFAADLPSALPPAALQDADLRLALEGGRPPVTVEGVDPAALLLQDLLARSGGSDGDFDALRTAPLPAATKHFVLGRWLRSSPPLPGVADALRLVDAVRRAERALGRRDDALPIGLHDLDGLTAVATGSDVFLLLPDGGRGLDVPLFAEAGDDDLSLRLAWAFPPDAPVAGTEIWRGRVEAPLAGTFVFSRMGGGAWWQSPAVRRWGGPAIALLLLLLALPVILGVELRRRRRLDEARVRFINEMAHDLRTPLTSLRLHAEMLEAGKGKPERRGDYLAKLAHESARLSDLLENLLDVARLERGRRTYAVGRVRVADVAREAADAFARLHPERHADLDLLGDEDTIARADPAALGRVLSNLLENAGKFTVPGTPIHLRWAAAQGRVQIEVADEGDGVPPAERRQVFQRYTRGARARQGGLPGSGLGLALGRELAAGMGGTLRLLDTAGRGATFRLELPGADDDG